MHVCGEGAYLAMWAVRLSLLLYVPASNRDDVMMEPNSLERVKRSKIGLANKQAWGRSHSWHASSQCSQSMICVTRRHSHRVNDANGPRIVTTVANVGARMAMPTWFYDILTNTPWKDTSFFSLTSYPHPLFVRRAFFFSIFFTS